MTSETHGGCVTVRSPFRTGWFAQLCMRTRAHQLTSVASNLETVEHAQLHYQKLATVC